MKNNYGNFPIYIHENGTIFVKFMIIIQFFINFKIFTVCIVLTNSTQPSYFAFVWYVFGFSGQKTFSNSSLDDWSRVVYLHEYIGSMANALRYFYDVTLQTFILKENAVVEISKSFKLWTHCGCESAIYNHGYISTFSSYQLFHEC